LYDIIAKGIAEVGAERRKENIMIIHERIYPSPQVPFFFFFVYDNIRVHHKNLLLILNIVSVSPPPSRSVKTK
jgi:hypothetical protein